MIKKAMFSAGNKWGVNHKQVRLTEAIYSEQLCLFIWVHTELQTYLLKIYDAY